MKPCHVCGNHYDKSFEIRLNNQSYTFDCFECAIHTLAPICQHCSCKIIGHGVEQAGIFYCCAHCAKKEGISALKDRA